MIHVFHGFLGSPKDFQFLKGPEVTLHDLFELDLNNFMLSPEDTLIGYSMGGRVAIELAARSDFNIKRLVLINSHPGLESAPEKIARRTWERMIEEKMDSEDFISFWNSQLIFSHDLPLPGKSKEDISRAKVIFQRYRLSEQKNYLHEIVTHKEKVLWIIGSRDEKYRSLADTHFSPQGVPFRIIDGGHRLYQDPERLRGALQAEGVL